MIRGSRHRWVSVALVGAVVVVAFAVHRVIDNRADTQRQDRIDSAQREIDDSIGERVFFLRGIADVIGVRDEIDLGEIASFSRAQSRYDPAIVSVQWLRRAPNGGLVASPGIGAQPVLIPTDAPGDAPLARADQQAEAQDAIDAAATDDRVATSPPVQLGNGHAAVYMAVPIGLGRYAGRISAVESLSVVVALVDTQALTEDAVDDSGVATSIAEPGGELASVGGEQGNPATATIEVHGREWTISVDGGTVTGLQRALPWLILCGGLLLTAFVTALLGRAIRRRDEALRIARQRTSELERRTREDSLTGIYNRRHFSELLAHELGRGGEGVAVLLLDLDHFKRVNDQLGHLAGDRVLQTTAARLSTSLRGSECLARWGGEEFAVLVPRIGRDDAMALAERLRASIGSAPFEAGDEHLPLTISVGVALAADGLHTADQLVAAADEALYAAKDAGRDAVRAWSPVGGNAPA